MHLLPSLCGSHEQASPTKCARNTGSECSANDRAAAGSGVRALAEKRAAEDDRNLASYISRLIEADAQKKSPVIRPVNKQ